jgi:hypothetical protein
MNRFFIFLLILVLVGLSLGTTTVTSDRKAGISGYDIVIDSNESSDSEVLHTRPIEGNLQWIGLIATGTDANGVDVSLVDEDGFVFYDNSSMDANDIHVISISDVDGNPYGGADVTSRFTLSWSGNAYTTIRFKVHIKE